ncbi:hypothetical protein [Mycobacterium sp. 236(2023)]|uniref:hypothetical protein n=1 Tax=Mycobacterium sp. 236(2023) TaxID=3038163 RepID=UPI00241595BF|nr:hypothetical protein [Mycobacterium sp. 236(2023)]MDG4668670.1 hypothetical protein [Mycobacterium sp. 236(2023)]
MRVLEQSEAGVEVLLGTGQVIDDGFQLLLKLLAAAIHIAEPLLDLLLRQLASRCHIEQIVFLHVELLELLGEVIAQYPRGASAVV